MISEVVVVTGKGCPACDTMKRNLQKAEVPYRELEAESDDGRKATALYRITSVPTIIVNTKAGSVHRFASGIVSVKKIKALL